MLAVKQFCCLPTKKEAKEKIFSCFHIVQGDHCGQRSLLKQPGNIFHTVFFSNVDSLM